MAAVLFVSWGIAGCASAHGGPLPLDADSSTVVRWARGATPPAWSVPLGPVHVDDLRPVGDGYLLVGTRLNDNGMTGRDYRVLDLETGRQAWRLDRPAGPERRLPLASGDALVVERAGEERDTVSAYGVASGSLLWRETFPAGDVAVQLTPDPEHLLLQEDRGSVTRLAALDTGTGATVWETEIRGMTKLLIEVEGLWSFSASDGVQRRELETGTSAWALDLPVPGPQDPAPRLAGGALYSAAEGELRAVDAETGELLWSSRLEGPAPPTNLHPLGDVVLVRSSPPGNWFQDGEDRWGVELPPAWSLSVHDGDRWTFRPELGSGRLTVATAADAHDPREMVEQQIAGVASSGWLDSSRVTHEELTLRGRPAHLVRAPFRAESGGTEIEMTAYLGAVAGSSSGPGLYWLAFVSRDEDERVGPLLEGAFRTIRVFSRSGGARADDERGRGAHHLAAYDADTGGYRWGFSTVRPTLSNVLLADGRLYVAGGRTLYALQASTGAPIFRVTASTSGGTFPVRLRLYEDRVVYVGELVISAFDRRTGAELYRRGFSPITQRAYLAGLDASIPRFRRRLAREGGRPAPSGGEGWVELSRWQGAQARRYQEMATSYANQAFSAQQLGRGMEAQTLQLKARMNRAWSRTQTNLALMSSVAGLFSAIEQIREARERRARIGQYRRYLSQQRYLRSSILSAYSQAETGDYVYRPTSTRPPEADGALTQVGIVHLPTGRWRTFPLSPRYLDYGLWNYLAAGRGLLLHHGLGLAPERYRYGEPMELAPHGEASTLEGFLVAVPVELPR